MATESLVYAIFYSQKAQSKAPLYFQEEKATMLSMQNFIIISL